MSARGGRLKSRTFANALSQLGDEFGCGVDDEQRFESLLDRAIDNAFAFCIKQGEMKRKSLKEVQSTQVVELVPMSFALLRRWCSLQGLRAQPTQMQGLRAQPTCNAISCMR
jgi:hypothetical protein